MTQPSDDQFNNRPDVAAFWQAFRHQFPTNDDAQAELIRRCLAAKEPCCDNPQLEIKPGQRSGKCKNCKKEVYYTAGTFLQDIRNFTAWLAAILSFEMGVIMSACQFAREVRCAYATGWEIFQKLRILMEREMELTEDTLTSGHFRLIINKRSTETPARQHPFAEVTEMRKLLEEQDSASKTNSAELDVNPIDKILSSLSEDHKRVYECLTDDLMHCDELVRRTGIAIGLLTAILVELEIAGLIETQGNRYRRSEFGSRFGGTLGKNRSAMRGLHSSVISGESEFIRENLLRAFAESVNYIKGCFHGTSRKYLQLYIAQLWPLADPARWTVGSLFRVCLNADSVRRKDILAYLSDFSIRIPYCDAPGLVA